MDHWLRCKIRRGQFSQEYAVRGETADGKGFSLFAEADDLKLDRPVPENRDVEIDGWLRVEVADSRSGLLLVRLPAQALERGYFITVDARNVTSERQARKLEPA